MQKNNLKLLECASEEENRPNGLGVKSHIVASKTATPLSPILAHIVQEVQKELGLESHAAGDNLHSEKELLEILDRVCERLGVEISGFERDEVLSQLEKNAKPFGILQELVDDQRTSDIIVTHYSKIAVQQGRDNLTTDLAFASQEDYEAFVERLLQRAGTSYSTKKPIADGMIGSFARIHAVHSCLCDTGPYLTIRLNRFPSITVEELCTLGVAPRAIFDYLLAVSGRENTVLVAGEVGTGKTTLVRAIASSFPSTKSILVIEDTPEIRLDHPHVRYMSTRDANTDGAGRVTPAECIRAGMRMAMNRIIFGEMRDAEAAEAFIDVCASGHPGLSTIHARSADETISRLELFLGRAQRGVSRSVIYEQISKAVQVIVHLNVCPETKKRRIFCVKEIGPVADNVIRQRDIFRYRVNQGKPQWQVLNRVSSHKEELEAEGVFLSRLPSSLELETERGLVAVS